MSITESINNTGLVAEVLDDSTRFVLVSGSSLETLAGQFQSSIDKIICVKDRKKLILYKSTKEIPKNLKFVRSSKIHETGVVEHSYVRTSCKSRYVFFSDIISKWLNSGRKGDISITENETRRTSTSSIMGPIRLKSGHLPVKVIDIKDDTVNKQDILTVRMGPGIDNIATLIVPHTPPDNHDKSTTLRNKTNIKQKMHKIRDTKKIKAEWTKTSNKSNKEIIHIPNPAITNFIIADPPNNKSQLNVLSKEEICVPPKDSTSKTSHSTSTNKQDRDNNNLSGMVLNIGETSNPMSGTTNSINIFKIKR